jgi:hypothetical protein
MLNRYGKKINLTKMLLLSIFSTANNKTLASYDPDQFAENMIAHIKPPYSLG